MKKALKTAGAIILIIALIYSVFIFLSSRKTEYDTSCLTVKFFDVGQADSSLLMFPDGKTVLIDCGSASGGDGLKKKIRSQSVKIIDLLIITHPHEDHLGGIDKILSSFTVKEVLLPCINGEKSLSVCAGEWEKYFVNENVRYAGHGETVLCGENYEISVISKNDDEIFSDMNECSTVIKVKYFNNVILYMGDAGKVAENILLENGEDIKANILKVGHHGAATASSEEFLKKAEPAVAVISVGKNNSYGHPNGEVIKRLNNIGAKIMRTDQSGDITVKIYEKGFNTYDERSEK